MSDPVFDTALDARSLLEASAGTGKTYALAGLFARAVIVERLRVPQVLAVTFTEKATQELRERIRARLRDAAALAADWHDDAAERDDPTTAMLRRLLRQALAEESLPSLRLRLARALRELDLAVIATIHGFCQRVLREHALDTAQPLAAASLETTSRLQHARLAIDLWRRWSRDAGGAGFLRRRFGTPQALARALRDLLSHEPLLPPAPRDLPPDPRPGIAQCWQQLADAFSAHGEQARAAIDRAIGDGVMKANEYKPEHVEALWPWLERACKAQDAPAGPHDKLRKYTGPVLVKGTLKARTGSTPASPLFDTIAPWCEAHDQLERWHDAIDLQFLHRLREDAQQRDERRKRDFNTCDYDDLIGRLYAATCDATTGPALAAALRAQFPRVLIDEFQDTDARQWRIFEALFGEGGLVLVGDPKQAIYRFRGGDVATYVRAGATAQQHASLTRNFRSRPALIHAVNALFAHAPPGTLGNGIEFVGTEPGGGVDDADFLVDGAPGPALQWHAVPPRDDGKDHAKPRSLRIAADLCADAIAERLSQASTGRVLCRDAHTGAMRSLQPRDIAVLVRDHGQARAMRDALAARGVPAAVIRRESLYAGEEAQDVLALLLALRSPGDDRRLRAALATPLLGWTAAAIAALDAVGNAQQEGGAALHAWQQRLVEWRTRWERHGPQALLADVVARNAARIVATIGGERRLANTLQLGELMQASAARSLGTQGQIDALRTAIATADADDESQQPRLESDAGRVQILTLHKSKGLEFPQVYLPFAALGRKKGGGGKGMAMYTDDSGDRVRHWKMPDVLACAGLTWDQGQVRHQREEREEDMRLLYVGLTRARHALWVCCGALAQNAQSALHALLGGALPDDDMRAGPGSTWRIGLPTAGIPARIAALQAPAVPAARGAHRRLQRDWWIHSFSQLHRQQAQGTHALVDDARADDEQAGDAGMRADDAALEGRRFSGTRFGNVLHAALEHADFAAWRDCGEDTVPATQRGLLEKALRNGAYREADIEAGVRELGSLVARTLNARMPEGIRLCDLPPSSRIAELEFHFGLSGAATRELLALLQSHGLLRDRRDFGSWQQLSGLMTGKLDLTYRVDGRVYVLDYKSNRLAAYDSGTLAEQMAASEYDLQALLYAVALHRWLRVRVGDDYDFDLHFGGARYVFCRGLDASDPTRGVFQPVLPRALVEATDALLASPLRSAA
ncbi:MAG: exodeoxyribonuclease V subunit beta [Luteimonas sp.]